METKVNRLRWQMGTYAATQIAGQQDERKHAREGREPRRYA